VIASLPSPFHRRNDKHFARLINDGGVIAAARVAQALSSNTPIAASCLVNGPAYLAYSAYVENGMSMRS
jgi:hypothetical protein